MRIARVVTVCAALISTLFGADTERSKRRSQSKDQLPESNLENASTQPITFTTLRPEATLFGQPNDASIHQIASRGAPGVRSHRFVLIRQQRASNRFENNRHRRQLIRHGKRDRVGRSYDIGDNHIDVKHVDTVLGQPEKHGERVVHIEPIYRVTKNKNIFDSIIDLIRRIVGTEKPLGPLVGPFRFPGIGDKVYVRLLEEAPPDHLVIRLISNLPAKEIEATMYKDTVSAEEMAKHSEVPSLINHGSLLSTGESMNHFNHFDAVSSIASDSLFSSSNNVIQATKASSKLTHRLLENGWDNDVHAFGSYNTHKHGNSTVAENRHRSPRPSIMVNNKDNWNFVDRSNDTRDYQDSFVQVYHFYPNESSKQDLDTSRINIEKFHDSLNVSSLQQEFSPVIPLRNHASNERFRKKFARSTEATPVYSLDFASKNMRYLNLDGSVDDSGQKDIGNKVKRNDGVFVASQTDASVDPRNGFVESMRVRRKNAIEISASIEKDQKAVSRENGNATATSSKVHRKLDGDRSIRSRNVLRNVTETNNEHNKHNGVSTFLDGKYRNESGLDYSMKSTVSPATTMKSVSSKEQSKLAGNSTESKRG